MFGCVPFSVLFRSLLCSCSIICTEITEDEDLKKLLASSANPKKSKKKKAKEDKKEEEDKA